jgi:hypothetical protein
MYIFVMLLFKIKISMEKFGDKPKKIVEYHVKRVLNILIQLASIKYDTY